MHYLLDVTFLLLSFDSNNEVLLTLAYCTQMCFIACCVPLEEFPSKLFNLCIWAVSALQGLIADFSLGAVEKKKTTF